MTKIILGNKDKMNTQSTLHEVTYLEFMADAKESDKLIFASATDYNISTIDLETQEVYIPAHKLNKDMDLSDHTYVYFDLENYPFFQAARAIIQKEEKPKGVLRYRRTVEESVGEAFLVSDLCVLTSLFGEPEAIKVSRTDASVIPSHIIILVDFGGGMMAHIEYTISNTTRIELEWSGVGHIVDFDSADMSPMQPVQHTELPLTYAVDSILALARPINKSLLKQLSTYRELLMGGTKA